jgi:hypothetical protein
VDAEIVTRGWGFNSGKSGQNGEVNTAAASELLSSETDKQRIDIKVLSGDGDINSAEAMENELENLGYKIYFTDMAPTSNFSQNTVFDAPNFQNKAKRLADSLSSKPVLKPISWPSVFDIIVVTGKKPAETDKERV